MQDKTTWNSYSSHSGDGQWPGIDSMYRLIIVAALRNKQLTRGAAPRIEIDPKRHRNTTIALEEVKRGLIDFTINGTPKKEDNDGISIL